MELQKNASKYSDSIFTLLLPDNSVYNQPGQVSMIDRAVDPQTGTIKTRLVFANSTGRLKAGMNTTILVKNNNAETYLLAPYKAVVEQMGEFFVFQVGDSNKVSQRKVILGTRINEKIIIKDGLKEGDKIVSEGVQKLKEGTIVNTSSQKPIK
jgi:membrane fusion protein (multidrug efflux system)